MAALNITMTTPTLTEPFEAELSSVVVNTLWLVSLVLTVMAALFAILALQWIRQYAEFPVVGGSKRAALRQKRFDALHRWGVPQIIMALSVLLQLSIFAFLVGLVVMLWSVNATVAKAVTATVALFLTLGLAFAMIPTFCSDCPYKSPLALAFNACCCSALYPLVWTTGALVRLVVKGITSWLYSPSRLESSSRLSNRVERILRAARFHLRRLQRALVILCARLSCKNWLMLEEQNTTVAARDMLLCQAVGWVTRTSPGHDVESLAHCLFERLDPGKAPFYWISSMSDVPYQTVPCALVHESIDLDALEERRPELFALLKVLILYACQDHAASRGVASLQKGENDAALLHLVIWLMRRNQGQIDERCLSYMADAVTLLDPVEHPSTAIAVSKALFKGSLPPSWKGMEVLLRDARTY